MRVNSAEFNQSRRSTRPQIDCPPSIALLSLAALPGTLGFVVQQGIVADAVRQKQWLILLAVVVAQTFAIAAALRLTLSEAIEPAPAQRVRKVVWALALACGALPQVYSKAKEDCFGRWSSSSSWS